MDSPLRVHIDETLVTIKQTFDDKTVSRAQVAYWYIIAGNKLLGQHVSKRDSGAFLTAYGAIPVLLSNTNKDPNIIKDRKYFELPGQIFDFDKDGGIEYISYISDGGPGCPPRFASTSFTRTTPSEAEWLMQSPYTAPSPKNPYWYRMGNYIYLLGLEKVVIKNVEMGSYQTIDPVQEIDIDAPFKFPGELLDVLKRQVVDLARFSWFIPSARANEGIDEGGQGTKQLPKVLSVNDQNQQQ